MGEEKCCGCGRGWTAVFAVLLVVVLFYSYGRPPVEVKPVIQYQADSLRNTLSVSGTSEFTVSPDEAYVYASVVTNGDSAQAAQRDNRRIANSVIDALNRSGVDSGDIETTQYNLERRYEWNMTLQKNVDLGYQLVHTLKVTTGDVEGVGRIVDAAIAAGANGVESVSFGLRKGTEKKVRDDALVKAAGVAKEKASLLSEAAGIRLGRVVNLDENFYYAPIAANVRSNALADYGAPSNIAPQKVDVSSSVHMVYEIA